MDGFLNVNKPAGLTSHDVVARLRRVLKIKRIGHAGTLDPDATGVLVIAINRATRLLPFLPLEPKTYRASLRFGVTTDTQDASGTILSEQDASSLLHTIVENALPPFTGEIRQVPPMYSAVHHQGKRLYELARQGVEVEREARSITVHSMTLLGFEAGGHPLADLEIVCSGGTYVRTLCHDLGNTLAVGGHMESLVRTRVGGFGIEDAFALEDLQTGEQVGEKLVTLVGALGETAAQGVRLSEAQSERVSNGNYLSLADPFPALPGQMIPVYFQNQLLGFARLDEGRLQPEMIFHPPAQESPASSDALIEVKER